MNSNSWAKKHSANVSHPLPFASLWKDRNAEDLRALGKGTWKHQDANFTEIPQNLKFPPKPLPT